MYAQQTEDGKLGWGKVRPSRHHNQAPKLLKRVAKEKAFSLGPCSISFSDYSIEGPADTPVT